MAEEKLWEEGFEGVTPGRHQILKLAHFDIELKTTWGAADVPLNCRNATPTETAAGFLGNVLEFSGNPMSEGVRAQMKVTLKSEERILRIRCKLISTFNAVVQIFNQDGRFVDEINVSDGQFDYSIRDSQWDSIGWLSMFYTLDYSGPTVDGFEGYTWKV